VGLPASDAGIDCGVGAPGRIRTCGLKI